MRSFIIFHDFQRFSGFRLRDESWCCHRICHRFCHTIYGRIWGRIWGRFSHTFCHRLTPPSPPHFTLPPLLPPPCCWKEGFQYLVSNSCSCSFSLAKPRGSLPRWSLEYLVSAKSTLGQHSTKDVSVPGSSQNTTHNMMAYAQLLVHQTGIGKSTLPPRAFMHSWI